MLNSLPLARYSLRFACKLPLSAPATTQHREPLRTGFAKANHLFCLLAHLCSNSSREKGKTTDYHRACLRLKIRFALWRLGVGVQHTASLPLSRRRVISTSFRLDNLNINLHWQNERTEVLLSDALLLSILMSCDSMQQQHCQERQHQQELVISLCTISRCWTTHFRILNIIAFLNNNNSSNNNDATRNERLTAIGGQ